jgi:predicted nuclease of predicted toxin-antitoxin system
MRFLVDANLPPDVAAMLATLGHDAVHTIEIGMAQARDREIWRFSAQEQRCIVTKDEDFVLLKAAEPGGPAVVWVRIGNAIRRVIIGRLKSVWPTVILKLEQGEAIVEVR